jgi:hypothetical protein
MELIRELCSFEGRGPGTDAERRAANMLAGRLQGMGRRTVIEPTYVHPNYALIHAFHLIVAIAGSVVATVQPAVGFALVLIAATSFYLDHSTRFYLLRSLFFRRASQNVVSPGTNPDAPLRVILAAHYDAARSGYVFGERSVKLARRMSERARLLLGPWRLIFWGGLGPLLPILGAQMAGFDPRWLQVVQVVPTILLILAAFLLIDIALSDIVPGAYDNASGVAAVMSVAEELAAEPAEHLDIWVLLTGAEECLDEGMRSWVRSHRGQIDRERTVILNVDSVSYGSVHYELSEGPIISYPMDRELVELCEALATAGQPEGGPSARPLRSPVSTDAIAARTGGLRVTTITSIEDGVPPPWYHTHDDTPDRVEPAPMNQAVGFVTALVRLLDRGAGRKAAPKDRSAA